MKRLLTCIALLALAGAAPPAGDASRDTDPGADRAAHPMAPPVKGESVFARPNLVAWCIVPFDAKNRTPAERAEMMRRLGIRRFAYDWRDAHLPTFEQELAELKKRDIELTAVWFPASMTPQARLLLDAVKKHGLKPQLWVTMDVKLDGRDGLTLAAVTAEGVRTIALEAQAAGCPVGLYNHGGWFGEPENQVYIIERLKRRGVDNVGIVYNMHHGHPHLRRFPERLARMKPHLLCLNLNGMRAGGPKILPVGKGDADLELLQTIRDSGYRGPVGILNHREEIDAEQGLKENLDGLKRLLGELNEEAAVATYDD